MSQKTREPVFKSSPDADRSFHINAPKAPPARRALAAIYGVYALIALLAVVFPLCVLLLVTPGVGRRRAVARQAARLFFLLIGSPVRGTAEAIAPHYPCIVVANHASYLDGLILTAALPPGFTYLIKHEMATFPIAGFVLRRLGSAFVNRGNDGQRQRVARALVGAARNGTALAFFPEGTFDATPGLKPFQPGAFAAATRAGLPVVPVLIRGSRHKLPSRVLLPRPGPLRVTAFPPLDPAAYPDARSLMHAARATLLQELGEPDLAPPPPPAPPTAEPTLPAAAAEPQELQA